GLGDEGGVQLGLLDLLDVQLDLDVVGDLGQVGAQPVGLGAAAADDDAGPGRVDVDAEPVARALDLDPADGGPLQLAHQVVADAPVLDEVVGVLAVAEPARLPVGGDTEAESVGVDLLTHYSSFSLSSAGSASPATASPSTALPSLTTPTSASGVGVSSATASASVST